jgi:hypothetical protein
MLGAMFQVLTAAGLKMTPFYNFVSCILLSDVAFRGVYCLHHQGDSRLCFCCYPKLAIRRASALWTLFKINIRIFVCEVIK